MAETNINSCCCGNSAEEIELQEQAMPRVVLIDEDCPCECDEIELYTAREPDIILFDEYAEEYVDDIVAARLAAEEARDAVETSAATIIEKENLLLDDHQTIKRELRQGISDIRKDIESAEVTVVGAVSDAESTIRGDISTVKTEVKSAITTASTSIKGKIADALTSVLDVLAEIKTDISHILFNELEECSEQDIDDMFEEEIAES